MEISNIAVNKTKRKTYINRMTTLKLHDFYFFNSVSDNSMINVNKISKTCEIYNCYLKNGVGGGIHVSESNHITV